MTASLSISCAAAEFPEQRFAPGRDVAEQYFDTVASGRAAMRELRVVICGLARNVAPFLPATIARIERLGRMFADYRVLIFENDSSDATPRQLEEWAASNRRVVAISQSLGKRQHESVRCLVRAEDMAAYRACCQAEVAARWPDFDCACVLDTDLPGGFSYDGVAHSFGSGPWDFVGSYGIIFRRQKLRLHNALHYDVWAFRSFGSYAPLEGSEGNALSWRRGQALLPVYSCFGGLGLYRMEAWLSARYAGGDIEHVALHRGMREAGYDRQFLNPSQIVLYGRKAKRFDAVLLSLDRLAHAAASLCLFT
jgi:hypothetical protein